MSVRNDVKVEQLRVPFMLVCNYADTTEYTCMVTSFAISVVDKAVKIHLRTDRTNFDLMVTASSLDVYPFRNDKSMSDLLSARFMAAMTGKSERVDLRAFTGNAASRNPSLDNLHPNYDSVLRID